MITVVTPSYNQVGFLRECIESVLSQDYANIEYIVIDGASTDESVRVIREYEDRLAFWESVPDAGQSDAINKGWRRGAGDILAWMNADDSYLPGAVTAAVGFLSEHPEVGIVYGGYRAIDERGQPIDAGVLTRSFDEKALMRCDFIPSGSTFIRTEVVREIGFLDIGLQFIMDWEFWLRASRCFSFAFLPQPLSNFRIYPAAKTWSDDAAKAREMRLVAGTLKARLPKSEGAHASPSFGVACLYLGAANFSRSGGERMHALSSLVRSFANAPFELNMDRLRILAHTVGVRRPKGHK